MSRKRSSVLTKSDNDQSMNSHESNSNGTVLLTRKSLSIPVCEECTASKEQAARLEDAILDLNSENEVLQETISKLESKLKALNLELDEEDEMIDYMKREIKAKIRRTA